MVERQTVFGGDFARRNGAARLGGQFGDGEKGAAGGLGVRLEFGSFLVGGVRALALKRGHHDADPH